MIYLFLSSTKSFYIRRKGEEMHAIHPHEIVPDMVVVLQSSDGEESHPMMVATASLINIHGWQDAVEISLICCRSSRSHIMLVGVNDFVRSGNRFHLIARP